MDAGIRKKMEIKTFRCAFLKQGYGSNLEKEIESSRGGVLIVLHANEFDPDNDDGGRMTVKFHLKVIYFITRNLDT
jgi:hypothetical protein